MLQKIWKDSGTKKKLVILVMTSMLANLFFFAWMKMQSSGESDFTCLEFIATNLFCLALIFVSFRMSADGDTSDDPSMYKMLIDTANTAKEGILLIDMISDTEGKIVWINDECCRIAQRSKNDIMRQDYMSLLTTDSIELLRKWDEEDQLQTRFGGYKVVEAVSSSGVAIPIELSISSTHYKGNRVAVVFVRDVRERRHLEKRMEQYASHLERMVTQRTHDLVNSERRFEKLMESMDDIVLSIDLEGRITYVNQAWTKHLDIPVDRVMNRHFNKYAHQADQEKLLTSFTRILEERSALSGIEFRYLNDESGEGGYQWFMANVSVISDLSNNITGVVVVGRNVTKQRQLDDWLARVERMESFGQLASGMAHDFNNLFHEAKGFISRIKRNPSLQGRLSEDVHAVESIIGRAAQFMRRLSSLASNTEPTKGFFSPGDSLSRILKLIERSFPDNIRIETDERSERLIEGDEQQFDQVFLNLLLNARDAMPDGGSIKVSIFDADPSHALPLPVLKPGDNSFVAITISDDGLGMSAKTVAKIFDPFFSTKAPGQGTGLGLPTVYGIVKAHQGMIDVESEPERGATFTISLPCVEKPVQAKSDRLPGGKTKLLFVDDNPEIRELTAEGLNLEGFDVMTAENGKQALEIFKKHMSEISVVVMDMVMPEMDGIETARLMKRIDPGCRVVLSTGNPPGLSWDRNNDDAVNRILVKPYELEKLIETIGEEIEKTDRPIAV